MKFKITLLVITSIMLLLACNENIDTAGDYDEKSIELLSDSIKSHLYRQDSLSQELVQKFDTLTQELNAANIEITRLQTEVDKNSSSKRWDTLSLLLSSLAFITVFSCAWRLRKKVQKGDVESIIDDHMSKSGVLDLMNQFQTGNLFKSNNANKFNAGDIKRLDGEISDLKRKISTLQQQYSHKQQSVPNTYGKPATYTTKRMYAKSTSASYFTETTENKEETSAFIIELDSDKTGTFDIASFVQVKQMNDLENFVHYKGICKLEEATNSKTIDKGICEKQSNGYWQVVKEMSITISK
jgi:hypothetical protein